MSEKIKIVQEKYDCKINVQKTVGENIKMLRESQNMTQEKFAENLFMNVRRISKIENNQVEPTSGEMLRICEVLQVSVLALFFNVRINEVYCDNRTGLSIETIHWLITLNRSNHRFIKILNLLSHKQKLFDCVFDVMNQVIKHF